ncbi:MAG: FAD-binding oxidoreductase [Deltaproteobacteria bacterium]|nr:FAD-binding oxidoreductase [Deltaproteobacteria bacterium]MBW1904992.1 FAD-binding oxidoreductase [Deltaproteobacteria bacterium]MBW2159997.1 FAD-binding oxidoreductase [Deltaproteobacteria bacterium]MBW2375929.1 FAD-binding oxidoreductase [Deltaproteobacteria bacterium]
MTKIVEVAKKWAEEHREWTIIGVALPLGTMASAWERGKSWFRKGPAPQDHDARVSRVQAEVKRYGNARAEGAAWAQQPLRTDRKGAASMNTRMSDKSGSQTVGMSDLTAILEVDEARGVVRLEPFVTVGEVARYLDGRGLQLEATIEMKDATMGGLVMAVGMTTHSHVSGLVHDTVTAYEIVTANGELVRATADNEHADLFRALPWSHGTLGLLVALEMRVIPASSHVRLVYRPFYSLEAYAEEYARLVKDDNPPHFLETLIFGKDRAVLMEGYLATEAEVGAGRLPINPVDHHIRPLFYKHVESMLELGEDERHEELIPMYDYLMRHDRSMCMCLAQILPTANEAWFRYTMGWMLPPNASFLKGTRPQEERENTIRKQVWQEYAFPAEHFADMVARVHDDFEIYPLLAYPCKVIDHGGLVRLPRNRGKSYSGRPEMGAYLDIGIYGIPQRIKDGDERFDTVTRVRKLEREVRSLGGFVHTYCDLFGTEDEFHEMFDHNLWQEMRTKYAGEGAFPTIYEKVKPEVDPLGFLDEERSWNADAAE